MRFIKVDGSKFQKPTGRRNVLSLNIKGSRIIKGWLRKRLEDLKSRDGLWTNGR